MSDRSRDWNPAAEFHSESICVTVCSLHVVDITKNGDCHVCAAISENERAEAAEAEIKRLQDEIARLEKLKERYRLDCLYHAECRPNRRQAEAAMADAKAVNDAMADEIAKNRALQDEIERLKGYVRHAPDCHIATDGNGEYTNCYRPLGGCSCGLAPETGAT